MKSKVTIKIDNSALGKQANKALDAYAKALDPVLDKQFTESQWTWPRLTRRRSGLTVGSPRNIVDSGELLNSKVGPTKGHGNAYVGTRRWVWNSPYASLVKTATSPALGRVSPPVTGSKPQWKSCPSLRLLLATSSGSGLRPGVSLQTRQSEGHSSHVAGLDVFREVGDERNASVLFRRSDRQARVTITSGGG